LASTGRTTMAKGQKYRTVKGKLGVFGWISRIVFLGFTILMVLWIFVGGSEVSQDVDNVGEAIGFGIGIVALVTIWVTGTVIFGIWVLLTRPPNALVPKDE